MSPTASHSVNLRRFDVNLTSVCFDYQFEEVLRSLSSIGYEVFVEHSSITNGRSVLVENNRSPFDWMVLVRRGLPITMSSYYVWLELHCPLCERAIES